MKFKTGIQIDARLELRFDVLVRAADEDDAQGVIPVNRIDAENTWRNGCHNSIYSGLGQRKRPHYFPQNPKRFLKNRTTERTQGATAEVAADKQMNVSVSSLT